ncbi:MAG: class I SAM-dependent methyltransferase [Schleiferiaceae bacterium]|nr:class I SAM-dependent methyltransferase [Schleiferiaceae bacterium]
MAEKYHPEKYWSEVGAKIKEREDGKNVIAGDDEPYYRYKRDRFLELLNSVDFSGKRVLEIGFGPGGNLQEVYKHKPAKLMGADISQEMVNLAKSKLPKDIELVKINGTELPFEDGAFDIVFTATVLQHNTDEAMLKKIIKEICRVSGDKVYLFERIESTILGDELCYGRPIAYYEALMKENGYALLSKRHINVRVSYYVAGAIRKGLNPKTRKEGDPLTPFSLKLQKITLPISKKLDKVFKSGKDVTKLEFVKMGSKK